MSLNVIFRGSDLRIAVGFAVLILLLAGCAGAETLTVDDSGGAGYTKIQGCNILKRWFL